MNVGPNHVFGSRSKPDLYKVEDLIQGRIPYYFNTGPNRKIAVMGAIRNHLRSLHYNHYKDLRDACQLLDPVGFFFIDYILDTRIIFHEHNYL